MDSSWFGRRIILSGLCLAAAFLTGCQTHRQPAQRIPKGVAATDIAALHLISVPIALDLDGKKGVDGVSLKVYANDWKDPKPVPIRVGTLQLQMFDGPFTTNSVPLRTWTFDPANLKPFQFTARIGIGYEFTLPWGQAKPKWRTVSLRGVYTAPNGLVLRSTPSSVTVEDMPKK